MDEWRAAMGISWMVQKEISQAIPPAYSEYIGNQLLKGRLNNFKKPRPPAGRDALAGGRGGEV